MEKRCKFTPYKIQENIKEKYLHRKSAQFYATSLKSYTKH